MKILLLTKKVPFPVKDGEALAIHNLSKALCRQGCTLDLLAMNTTKHLYAGKDAHSDLPQFRKIRMVEMDTSVRIREAIIHLFKPSSYNVARFDSDVYRKALVELLEQEEYDVVQLETLYLSPYIDTIRQHSQAKIVMRAHNVEHEIWQRITDNTPWSLRKWYLGHLTRRLRRYEVKQLQAYDYLLPITGRDGTIFRQLGYRGREQVVPIGVDLSNYRPDYSVFRSPYSLSFIGSLDWMPNLEGLKWFLEKIWRPVQRNHPELSLHVAGRNTPEWLHHLANRRLQIPGEVAEATTFINQHAIMIVPLLSGSGMRAKILEGMALGRVVLTTSIGLEGIDARHRQEVLIADTPEAFMEELDYILQSDPAELRKIGEQARILVREQYDNMQIAKKLLVSISALRTGVLRP